jgi:hypothetical protein
MRSAGKKPINLGRNNSQKPQNENGKGNHPLA